VVLEVGIAGWALGYGALWLLVMTVAVTVADTIWGVFQRRVPADIAGPAMDAARAEPGHFFERTLAIGGKTVRFANAFACNDVDSLALLWPSLRETVSTSTPSARSMLACV
jgi:hypothetical protein